MRAKALTVAGAIANFRGDRERAESLLEESVALYRQMGDKRGLEPALHNLGHVAADGGTGSGRKPSTRSTWTWAANWATRYA